MPYLHSPFLSIHCALLYVMGWRPDRQFISLHCRINAQAYSTLTTLWSTKRLDVWISSQYTHILGGFFPKTPIKSISLFFLHTISLCCNYASFSLTLAAERCHQNVHLRWTVKVSPCAAAAGCPLSCHPCG